MESVAQQLKELSLSKDETLNSSPPVCIGHGKVAELVGKISQRQNDSVYKRLDTPPKPPIKYKEMPQVPSSRQVLCSREPLYSQPLIGVEKTISGHMPFRKYLSSEFGAADTEMNRKTTLDNPAILEQQLEALAYHKLQMEKKGLLGLQAKPTQSVNSFSEPLSKTLSKSLIYCNLDSVHKSAERSELFTETTKITASTYANVHEADIKAVGSSLSSTQNMISVCTNFISDNEIDDLPPPPSPESAVSSSYSELRRATSEFNKPIDYLQNDETSNPSLQIYANQYALQHDAISKNLLLE
ncbi:uncharacterized protein LOC6555826 isoform X4 [Drosophila erecta]|uniref:uncharacterized protein LOC6555826 isoform X4 n=1 Tax=Drosophila erecta TaxID=7220 RepID=UPI000F045458|nr:uncharacterized protein LOC6555826 isoform X4 [Drosophila erecta]